MNNPEETPEYDTPPEGANRLIRARSPYLLQHARNPVDWYPWGPEARDKARRDDKPIFLSIGYFACHWCHVMERESFEDAEVARLLNEGFVCVKVDREERPDIDNLYMTVCQMITGGGGWPLTVFLTPRMQPFFAGTYFPRESRYQLPGLLDLLPRIRHLWQTRRDELESSAAQIVAALRDEAPAQGREIPGPDLLHAGFHELARQFDPARGGFGRAPKFPTAHHLLFLLRYWNRFGNAEALAMVEKTLMAMRAGGIFDQIGFGFHRYSTDERWLVPHFEKMLYNQALLALAYLEAGQATGREAYRAVAREIFTYVRRDMTSPEGGFYAAEDADSEGVEGKYYLWSEAEIHRILTADDAAFARSVFSVRSGGNFSDSHDTGAGWNILHLAESPEALAGRMNLPPRDFASRLDRIRQILREARESRVRPLRDDKILTDWNGLMIAALAVGARQLQEPAWAELAARAAGFITGQLRTANGRLLHRYWHGDAAVTACLDDYSCLIWGLLELYFTTFDLAWLRVALELQEDQVRHFWDDREGGFFLTPDDGEALLHRPREIHDGAVPSGNSMAMHNLLRLGRLSGRTRFEELAASIGEKFAGTVRQVPAAHTHYLTALDLALGPPVEVVLSGPRETPQFAEMVRAMNATFQPGMVALHHPGPGKAGTIRELIPWMADLPVPDDRVQACVCRNHACQAPVTDAVALAGLLKG